MPENRVKTRRGRGGSAGASMHTRTLIKSPHAHSNNESRPRRHKEGGTGRHTRSHTKTMTSAPITPTAAWRLAGHDGCSPSRCHCVPPLLYFAVEQLCWRGEKSAKLAEVLGDVPPQTVLAVVEAYRGTNCLWYVAAINVCTGMCARVAPWGLCSRTVCCFRMPRKLLWEIAVVEAAAVPSGSLRGLYLPMFCVCVHVRAAPWTCGSPPCGGACPLRSRC